jgi:hypothetical protein
MQATLLMAPPVVPAITNMTIITRAAAARVIFCVFDIYFFLSLKASMQEKKKSVAERYATKRWKIPLPRRFIDSSPLS